MTTRLPSLAVKAKAAVRLPANLASSVARTPGACEEGLSTKRHKYGAKAVEVDGIRFASKMEAKRYGQLKLLAAGGVIENLVLQPKFPIVIDGTKVCEYRADFSYFENGKRVVEDVKTPGTRTRLYILKSKLVHALYPGVRITEVTA